jgi:proteasome lid subunit RPN8/RPN11
MNNFIDKYFSSPVQTKIKKHSKAYPDVEVCGIVVLDGQTQKAYYGENVSDHPSNSFELADYILRKHADKELLAVYHSHCNPDSSAFLSAEDIYYSKNFSIPFICYHEELDAWDYFDPNLAENPYPLTLEGDSSSLDYYLGWQWQWNRCDCCSLFKAYYKGRLGIDLEDHPRALSSSDIFQEGWNDFERFLPDRGFFQWFGKPEVNDLVLMSIEGQTIHHVGVMVEPNRMLHLYNEKYPSDIVIYEDSLWQRVTRSVWRWNSFS